MNAQDKGAREGLEYARRQRIEQMTFAAYCAAGKALAEQRYQQEKARFGFTFGWRQAGECNRTIFKLDDEDIHGGEKQIQVARSIIANAAKKIEPMRAWREEDRDLHALLVHAYEMLNKAQYDLDRVLQRL